MDKRVIIVALVVLVLIFIGVKSCGNDEKETVLPEEEMQTTFDEKEESTETEEPVIEDEDEYVDEYQDEDTDYTAKLDKTADVEIESVDVAEEVKKETTFEEKEEDFFYIVRPGDTLWSLSLEYYVDPYKYNKIANFNEIRNPERIYPGMRIDFPGSIVRRDYLYTVKPGDTLWEIAGRVYDDHSMWKFLAGYNGISISDRVIWKGMKLRIPFKTEKYISREGEDLFSISEEIYGSHYFAYKLMQYNNLDDMHWVRPGSAIYYPVIDYRK